MFEKALRDTRANRSEPKDSYANFFHLSCSPKKSACILP
jgi:hypothetical protein